MEEEQEEDREVEEEQEREPTPTPQAAKETLRVVISRAPASRKGRESTRKVEVQVSSRKSQIELTPAGTPGSSRKPGKQPAAATVEETQQVRTPIRRLAASKVPSVASSSLSQKRKMPPQAELEIEIEDVPAAVKKTPAPKKTLTAWTPTAKKSATRAAPPSRKGKERAATPADSEEWSPRAGPSISARAGPSAKKRKIWGTH